MENPSAPAYISAFSPDEPTDSVNSAVFVETGNANVTELQPLNSILSTPPELIRQESNLNWVLIAIGLYLIF